MKKEKLECKECLENVLTDIVRTYLNNDRDLRSVANDIFARENAKLALSSGHSEDEFLKSNAVLLKGFILMGLATGSVNPLYADLKKAMIDAIDFETLAREFYEESI